MRTRKHERDVKRRRGQFMTPPAVVRKVIDRIEVSNPERILEPSCGNGRFIDGIVEWLEQRGDMAQPSHVTGVEIDRSLAMSIDPLITDRHAEVDIHIGDFFNWYLSKANQNHLSLHNKISRPETYDLIIGNPPFGGSFDQCTEDQLDAHLGRRFGQKIKKETYAFFIVACVDLLREGGQLLFVCSDTLLTIPTMAGLRRFLMKLGRVEISDLPEFSDETSYPMVILNFHKQSAGIECKSITRNGQEIQAGIIESTPNSSWNISSEHARLFQGPLLADMFVASSGMTTGKNEYFVREVDDSNKILEPFSFSYVQEPITVQYELDRARLNRLPTKKHRALSVAEERGETQRRLRVREKNTPTTIQLPHPDYKPYNKANSRIIYSDPTHVIYWKNDGDAVLTYKKTGNWYLRGVGGRPYFGREALTWQLVASRFVPRYLPEGYILDSGAPCAFLKDGISKNELYFTLGWLLSPLANRVLKTVINHTRNIQSKDFERLPYPWWVMPEAKRHVVTTIKKMICEGVSGRKWTWDDEAVADLGRCFEYSESQAKALSLQNPSLHRQHSSAKPKQFSLFATMRP